MQVKTASSGLEPVDHGHRRIPGHEHPRGRGQPRHDRSLPPQRQRQECDRAHHRGSQDARLPTRQDDEPRKSHSGQSGREPWPGPQQPQQQQDSATDDRDIRPADRHQVGEPGVGELPVESFGQPARVADDQTRHQPRLLLRQHVAGSPESFPHRLRPPLPPRCLRRAGRRSADVDRGDRQVCAERRGEFPTGGDLLAGEDLTPGVERREKRHPARRHHRFSTAFRGQNFGRDDR